MIACLTEYFREERIVAPLTLLSHHMHGEHILKNITRQIPRCNNIGKGNQSSRSSSCHLPWCRRFLVSIELRMMLVITLTNNQHDVRTSKRTTIHLYLVLGCNQLFHLFVSQLVGEHTEDKTIQRQIELRMLLLCQFVFNLSYILLFKHFYHQHFVAPRSQDCPDKECNQDYGQEIRYESDKTGRER